MHLLIKYLSISGLLLGAGAHAHHPFKTSAEINGWRALAKAPEENQVYVTFAVKQKNIDLVEELLLKISDPKSESFMQYLTHEEVGQMVSNPVASGATLKYLSSIGVDAGKIESAAFGTYIHAHMSVSTLNKHFGTDFYVYGHPDTSHDIGNITRTASYSIPDALQEHVGSLFHINHFGSPRSGPVKRPDVHPDLCILGICVGVSPSSLAKQYGISGTVTHGATQAVLGFFGFNFNQNDLSSFHKANKIQSVTVNVVGLNDPSACARAGDSCGEPSLDLEYITAVGQGAATTYWKMDQNHNYGSAWAAAAAATANPPQVFSISYGQTEAISGPGESNAFCNEVMKLGLRGVSVIVSSGDDGVANNPAADDSSKCGYVPDIYSGCPYTTSLGATQGQGKSEVAASRGTCGIVSGGGFSSIYSTPAYQSSHVSNYINNVAKSKAVSGYNANGRGYPDVSLIGCSYDVIVNGRQGSASGTSATAPAFAGMITLVNDARLAAGKPPLGFLNQMLYALPSSTWNDITSGDNKCTAGSVCCKEGFVASSGWDPVTGLGSPNFGALNSGLLAMNPPTSSPTFAPTLASTRAPTLTQTRSPTDATTTVSPPTSPQPLASSLLAYYPMFKGLQATADFSGNGKTAAVTSTVVFTSNSLDFNGKDMFMSTPIANGGTRTLSAWVYPRDVSSGRIFDSDVPNQFGSGFGLVNGQVEVILDDAFWSSGVRISANNWQHIALTFNNAQAQVYVNGTLKASFPYTQNSITNAMYVIGKSLANTTPFFNGLLREVRIHSAVASAADVVKIMNTDAPGSSGRGL